MGSWYLDDSETLQVNLVTGLIGIIMASYDGLEGILTGVTKSTDHPNMVPESGIIPLVLPSQNKGPELKPTVAGAYRRNPFCMDRARHICGSFHKSRAPNMSPNDRIRHRRTPK